ncbi:DNA polymerase III subunit chi [Hyphomicrobiales bacterium]|nr:DNA polymerase III subunit chi [Hyphomicrobiales bacterium]
MTEIFFYKLKNTSIDLFLISLIEKSISKNWNSLVLLDNTERMEEINDLLWTFNDTSFIPHGSQSDPSPDKQNVYLTCNEENLNNSNIIFSTDGVIINEPDNWNRCIYIFNEQNLKVTDELESYKREVKDFGYTLKSFEQDNNGKWITNN